MRLRARRRRRSSEFALAVLLAVLITDNRAPAQNRIIALGALPGLSDSFDAKVSSDGSTVVGVSGATTATRAAFRWTASTGMVKLSMPPGTPSNWPARALDVSADGSVVIGEFGSGLLDDGIFNRGFRWTELAGAMEVISPFGSDWRTRPTAISNDGLTIVGTAEQWVNSFIYRRPFRWTEAGGATPVLDHGVVFDGSAVATSADAQTVVGTAMTGYRWTEAGGVVSLPQLYAGRSPRPNAISADGSIIAGSTSVTGPGAYGEAVRWVGNAVQGLGDLPGGDTRSETYGLSPDGQYVLGLSSGEHMFEAFIWDAAHGMRAMHFVLANDYGIDMTGWQLVIASDMSANNDVIVGTGYDPNGRYTVWVAYVPEPAVLSTLAIAMAQLLARHRRAKTVTSSRPRPEFAAWSSSQPRG